MTFPTVLEYTDNLLALLPKGSSLSFDSPDKKIIAPCGCHTIITWSANIADDLNLPRRESLLNDMYFLIANEFSNFLVSHNCPKGTKP